MTPTSGYWSAWSPDSLTPTSWIFNLPAGSKLQWRARVQCGFLFWSKYYESKTVVTIQNTPPTPPTACAISPLPADTTTVLTASASGATDVDGQECTYDYRWYVQQSNGLFAEAFHGNPLPALYTSGNQVWYVTAGASDGVADSETRLQSKTVTITNAPPTAPTSLTIDPAAPTRSNTITATATGATDPDNVTVITDPISYEFQWYLTVPPPDKPRLMGSGRTMQSTEMRRGQSWFVRARTADSHGGKSGWVSHNFTIANSPPTAPTTVTITPPEPTEDQNLTGDASGYGDADPGASLTVTYQWVRFIGKRQYPGSVGRVLPSTSTSPGQVWAVRAKASDGTDESGWKYSGTVTIADVEHPPTAPTTVEITTLAPVEGDLIHFNVAGASDPDGTDPGYEFQWRRGAEGEAWGDWGSDGTIVAGTVFDPVGTRFQMRARSTDGTSFSAWVVSNTVVLRSIVTSTQPAAGAPDANRLGGFEVSFARPVDQADVEARFRMTVGNALGQAVPGSFVWLDANLTFRYRYAEPLQGGTQHTVVLYGPIDRLDGSMFGNAHSWVFSTNDAPVVTAKRPTGRNASVASNVVVTFDRAMSFDSVRNGFAITPSVPGTWSAGPARQTFTFNPDSNMAADTNYRVELAGSIQDSTGLTMGAPFTWSFRTAAAGAPATVAGTVAAAAARSGGSTITLNLVSAASVQVSICNLAGRTVAVLPPAAVPAGLTTLVWAGRTTNGSQAPRGVYLVKCHMTAAGGATASAIASLQVR